MKKVLTGLLVLSTITLFGCGKKKASPKRENVRYINEKFDLEKLLDNKESKTTIYNSYVWEKDENNYIDSDRITTKYDSLGRKIDELHEIFNRKNVKGWCGYTRDIYEYDDEAHTMSCYDCFYVTNRSAWFPESKTITNFDDDGNIINEAYYWCSQYDSEDYESKYILEITYDYIYDKEGKLSEKYCNHYQGLGYVFYVEKTEYNYNDDNQLVLEVQSRKMNNTEEVSTDYLSESIRRKKNNSEYKIEEKTEYTYNDNLLVNKMVYLYHDEDNSDVYVRDLYTYYYDENNNLSKEIFSQDYAGVGGVFVETRKKEYEYAENKITCHNYCYCDVPNMDYWIYTSKDELITIYSSID